MRLAFLGTPDFAVPSLAALIAAGHEIACVYSQPPAPRGRGQALGLAGAGLRRAAGPAGAHAESLREPAEIEAFRALGLDAAVVVAFGQILPEAILEAPRLGASTCTPRCCRAGGARRRSSARSWPATR